MTTIIGKYGGGQGLSQIDPQLNEKGKKGQKSMKEVLREVGEFLLNSGKMN